MTIAQYLDSVAQLGGASFFAVLLWQIAETLWSSLVAVLFGIGAQQLSDLDWWKSISEVIRNVGQGFVFFGAVFAWWSWRRERRNRSVDVMRSLESRFTHSGLSDARWLIESDRAYSEIAPALRDSVLCAALPRSSQNGADSVNRCEDLSDSTEKQLGKIDALLRFYVFLYGVKQADQIPVVSLRSSYRYWLTLYFKMDDGSHTLGQRTGAGKHKALHSDRLAFRAYVDWFFPTLSAWLHEDERRSRNWFRRRQRFFDPLEYEWGQSMPSDPCQMRRAIGGRVLVITGAGISAGSGLPTFRGKDGYWRKRNPKMLATRSAFEADPDLVWQWYLERFNRVQSALPNAAHRALVELSKSAADILVVTQNVDDLHERARSNDFSPVTLGQKRLIERHRSEQIVHIHGEISRLRCTRSNCDGIFQTELFTQHGNECPRCPNCGYLLRPDVVWFDEDIEPTLEGRIDQFIKDSVDLVLVIGTTATFDYIRRWALEAVTGGAWMIEINPEKTSLSRFAHSRISSPVARVLPKLVSRAKLAGPPYIG